ncbi:hypothetical protein BKA57DRAFT_213081 [Linnemannia elongata]|nr:hypothetical protein BKA57DRAFT_213081 [Linnemannia elongata]
MCSSNICFFPTLSATTIAMEAVTKEHMEDRAVDMVVVVDMEDTASSSHTSSQHHLQEDTVSNTVADTELRLPPLPPLLPAPTLLSSRLLMLSTTVTNTALPLLSLELMPLLLRLQLPCLLSALIPRPMAPTITLATVNTAPLPLPRQQPPPQHLLLPPWHLPLSLVLPLPVTPLAPLLPLLPLLHQ